MSSLDSYHRLELTVLCGLCTFLSAFWPHLCATFQHRIIVSAARKYRPHAILLFCFFRCRVPFDIGQHLERYIQCPECLGVYTISVSSGVSLVFYPRWYGVYTSTSIHRHVVYVVKVRPAKHQRPNGAEVITGPRNRRVHEHDMHVVYTRAILQRIGGRARIYPIFFIMSHAGDVCCRVDSPAPVVMFTG